MEKKSKIKQLISKFNIGKFTIKNIDIKQLNINLFSIKVKIIALVVIFNVISTSLFTYYMYSNTKKAMMPVLYNHSKSVAYGANNILKKYHDGVKSSSSISKKSYDKMVKELSDFAKHTEVKKIYSVISYKKEVVYTATSSTKKEMEGKSYGKYFDSILNIDDTLKNLLNNKSKDLRYKLEEKFNVYTHSLFIPFSNRNGIRYIICIDNEIDYLNATLKNMSFAMITIGLIFFILMLSITIFLMMLFFRRFDDIENSITKFFQYINKETAEYKYIDQVSIRDDYKDELSKISKMINNYILVSVKNVKKDDEMLNKMQNVSNSISRGIFKYRIDIDANSPILNESKDMLNKMFDAIQTVVFEISKIADEYSNFNFKAKIKTEHYDDTFLQLAQGINMLGSHFSREVKDSAKASMDIQKGSNNVRQFIEDIKILFEMIINQVNELEEHSKLNEKFNIKLQYKIAETIKEKEYISNVVEKLKDDDIEYINDIEDMELSLHKFMQKLNVMTVELEKQNIDITHMRRPLNMLRNTIKQNNKMSENVIKLASELSSISNKIRESVEQSNFEGKDNINAMMQNINR